MIKVLIKDQPIHAIDLGTTKFCAAQLNMHADQARAQLCSVPAQGMARGMLSQFDRAKEKLHQLLDQAESRFQTNIKRVVTGIAGSHLMSESVEVTEPLHGQIVTQSHLELLQNKGDQNAQRFGKELLHLVPLSYRLDEREWQDDPQGFSCRRLHGRFLAIYCDESYCKDVIRLFNQCGLQVEEIYAEPFASATVSVSENLRQSGCAVADIGGGTTDGMVFQNGRPVHLFTCNVAGHLISKDISIGLNVDFDTAERIKHHFGLGDAPPLPVRSNDSTPITVVYNRVHPIIAARVVELGGYIADGLHLFKGSLPGGIVLTGGGSHICEIENFLQQHLKVPIVCRSPQLDQREEVKFLQPLTSNVYATVVGFINLELSRRQTQHLHYTKFWPAKYLTKFVNWIRELS